ncbi:prolyl oligopeptidase family serine peptidase [Shewanella sp. 10N.286.52.B9]|uniref:S9 family peptidase n=1 Tax=Shewanella sp. 10N.286.52.B9 TaxID=1880837 RepID=UPI000C85D5C6|nr:prolyl oligopeptidase family serine peptidase [Shewanella sp. 10N.286.52.B9]PMG49860.1 peptidase S9 [Shewanella sp. 10N.286.52.B9]
MKLRNLIPLTLLAVSMSAISADNIKPLLLDDIMRFETLQTPVISENGTVLAVEAMPDRGNSRALVNQVATQKQYQIDGGSDVKVSANGDYVIATIAPSLLEKETLKKSELSAGLSLLNTKTGNQQQFKRVKQAEFSTKGDYLAVWFDIDDTKEDGKEDAEETSINGADKGSGFKLIQLATNTFQEFDHVTQFNFDRSGNQFVVAINDIAAKQHVIKKVDLITNTLTQVYKSDGYQVAELSLSDDGNWLGFTQGDASVERDEREYQLKLLALESLKLKQVPTDDDWTLNQHSKIFFSEDSLRLFIGRVPQVDKALTLASIESEADLFDQQIVTGLRDLKVWHGDDPKIKPHEVKQYAKELKRTYLAVMHVNANRIVQLADKAVPDVHYGEQKRYLLATSDVPYQKMITWAGFYQDVYLVDLNTGRKLQILTQHASGEMPSLSPNGRFVAYYQQGGLFLYDIANARKHSLTKDIAISFANEDHDYPGNAPSYGLGPWLADGSGIIGYDKYDVWQFSSSSFDGFMLSAGEGRKNRQQFRLAGLYATSDTPAVIEQQQALLLHGYNEHTKADSFYRATVGVPGVSLQLETEAKLTVLARSKNSDTMVFSKQRYDLYPDLYTSSVNTPNEASQQTDLDSQRDDFNWGAAELVRWRDGDGRPADGVLIKPTNYQAGKQYPVMVYFYRFMSDRLHSFPHMAINHRPNFAWYADNGYAIFLPDIRFEVGYPGISSVKALTAGVQKIIDMGVADPDAIGIQGHSWGGYQTAFAVTQTNIFKAAVTGAPVSNMTSAYSGIRHGSGLARQFQYETGQSRIAESLFKSPQKYIENSPVFYAERIQTPMMIMFGDKDDAVPWEQGVELYLAMRRTGKDVVFLQYEDEPHHLKKYPNKLDYTIRMKQYFDHYLKGVAAPKWLKEGEAYREYNQD